MNYPEETETQRREREEAEDKALEHEMEYRRETNMNEWELTSEEIQGIITDGYIRHVDLGIPGCRQAIDRDIATAAQRKLVEWLKMANRAGQCYDSDLVDKWDLLLGWDVWERLQLAFLPLTEQEEIRRELLAKDSALSPHQEAGN